MHSETSVPDDGRWPPTGTETLHTIFGTRKPSLEPTFLATASDSVTTNPRIVIIDDEPINIRVVRRMLMLAGYEQFFTTTDPAAALELIRSCQPDVVLLDIMMPEISGLEILRQLRDDEKLVDLPVIILTAATERETKLEALRLGATEFLTKPVDSTELEARLRNVLKVKAHQDWIKRYAWELELEVAVRTTELIHAHVEVIGCLAKVGEYRDTDTGNHVLRVGSYAGIIAQHLGLDAETAQRIRLAAPLHDIGKVGIPDAILQKPGRLDEIEMDIIRKHSPFGERLCTNSPEDPTTAFISHSLAGVEIIAKASSPVLQMAASIAYTHHEKWDGSGYPRGLAGEAIPVEGRITAVADVFDALCSRRPYKKAFPPEEALAIIQEGRGTHFDPAVVDAFFQGLDEILAAHSRFADDDSAEAPWTDPREKLLERVPPQGDVPEGAPAASGTAAAGCAGSAAS